MPSSPTKGLPAQLGVGWGHRGAQYSSACGWMPLLHSGRAGELARSQMEGLLSLLGQELPISNGRTRSDVASPVLGLDTAAAGPVGSASRLEETAALSAPAGSPAWPPAD